jgi:DNA modification methylase
LYNSKPLNPSKNEIEPLHRFHTYCARFPSALAEAAIKAYTKSGDSVFDPFCGSGTSLVAGLVHGRGVVGVDIDVLAGMLSEVKCFVRQPHEYERWRIRFGKKLSFIFDEIEREWSPFIKSTPASSVSLGSLLLRLPAFPQLNYWFPPQLTIALAAIAEAAHQCRNSHFEKVALVSLSASIIAKWPNTLSYAMDIDHTRPHRRIQQFRLRNVLETYLQRLDRTIACLGALFKIYRASGVLKRLPTLARIFCPHDSRNAVTKIQGESQALILTSPPYFDAVDYPRAHRMAVCWMNGYAPVELATRQNYLGLHTGSDWDSDSWLHEHPTLLNLIPSKIMKTQALTRRLTRYFAGLEKVLAESWRTLRPGGYAIFVIGDNFVKGQRIANHSAIIKLAQTLGFRRCNARPRAIVSIHRRYPVGLFGFDGPMTHEFVTVLQKPKMHRSEKTRSDGRRQ